MTAEPAIGKSRYLPVLEMIWPELIDTTSSPAISGSSSTPEAVGESPLTTWKKAGRYVMAPNMAKPMTKPTMLVTANVWILNRCSGKTGSRHAVRRWRTHRRGRRRPRRA